MSNFLKGIFGKDEADQASMVNGVLDASIDVPLSRASGDALHSYDGNGIEYEDQAMDELSLQQVRASDIGDTEAHVETGKPRVFDIAEIWKARNVTAQQQERVTKTQAMLAALPTGIPADAKRQIVEASLKAFGVSIDEIVSGASHEIDALEHFINSANRQAEDFAAKGTGRIEELEAEIENIRQTMKDEELEKIRLVGSANEVIAKVTPILEFFEPGSLAMPAREAMTSPSGTAGASKKGATASGAESSNEAQTDTADRDDAPAASPLDESSESKPKLPPVPR